MSQISKSVFAAREAAEQWEAQATRAQKKGDASLATEAKRKGELERTRMHKALADMAQLQSEQKALERAEAQARMVGAQARPAPSASASAASSDTPRPTRPPSVSVDDELAKLKRQTDVSGGTSASSPPPRAKKRKKGKTSEVDRELEALKRKMSQGKKPGDNR